MLSYGVKNIRRLECVDPIEIKPITLLLGRNSGGKSSFLRTFPLLRQSLMTRTSSPILWYGDLVDFGSFDTVISKNTESKSIYFSYVIDKLSTGGGHIFFGDESGYFRRSESTIELRNITYSVGIERRGERTRISSIKIDIENPNIEIRLEIDDLNNVSSLSFNGEPILAAVAPHRISLTAGSLFPELRFLRLKDDSRRDPWSVYSGSTLMPALTRLLRKIIDKRTKDKSIVDIAGRLIASGFMNKQEFEQIGKNHGVTVGQLFRSLAQRPDDNAYKQISVLMNAAALPALFKSIAQHLRSILSATLYIGPARARSERYYRYQDLAVSEIDPDGKNFPMFLNSLGRPQIEAFSKWVQSLFGYGVSVSRQTGHISINLLNGKSETNIVDVGYGVSQILPVLGQIWWARNRPSTRNAESPLSLLAIEQPELHLHPAHQALLADALVGETAASTEEKSPIARMHYIVETHSETLVNRIGEFIAAGRIAPSDVQVMLFEPNDETGKTTVRTVKFDEAGTLMDWPYGFFQPAVV